MMLPRKMTKLTAGGREKEQFVAHGVLFHQVDMRMHMFKGRRKRKRSCWLNGEQCISAHCSMWTAI